MKHGQGYTANNHFSEILVVLSPTVDPMGLCNISGQFERYSRCLGRVLECPDHDVDVKGRKSGLKIRDHGKRIESDRTIVLLPLRSTCSRRFEIGQACTTQSSDNYQHGNFYHHIASWCLRTKASIRPPRAMLRVSVYVPQTMQLRSELLTRQQSNSSGYS